MMRLTPETAIQRPPMSISMSKTIILMPCTMIPTPRRWFPRPKRPLKHPDDDFDAPNGDGNFVSNEFDVADDHSSVANPDFGFSSDASGRTRKIPKIPLECSKNLRWERRITGLVTGRWGLRVHKAGNGPGGAPIPGLLPGGEVSTRPQGR